MGGGGLVGLDGFVMRGFTSGGMVCRMGGLGGDFGRIGVSTDLEACIRGVGGDSEVMSLMSLLEYKTVPGTVRIISQRFGSLLNRVVLVFVKCDVQFFCFSISSLELNFRSGFSGFSGFSNLNRDVFCIFDGSRFGTLPFVTLPIGYFVRFGDGVRILSRSGLESPKLSSLLLELVIFKLSAAGRGTRFSTPSFSNRARALLNRVEWDSVRTTFVGCWQSFVGSLESISTGFRWNKFAICDTFGPDD